GEHENGALQQAGRVEVTEAQPPWAGHEQGYEVRDDQGEHDGRQSPQQGRQSKLRRSSHAFLHSGCAGSSTPGRWSSRSTSAARPASSVLSARAATPSRELARFSSAASDAPPPIRPTATSGPMMLAIARGFFRDLNARDTRGSTAVAPAAVRSAKFPPVKRPSRSFTYVRPCSGKASRIVSSTAIG